jgi:hypothetical protein
MKIQRIQPCGLFHTPENLDQLMAWCERHPAHDGTRLHVMTAAMMAWNLACKIAKENHPEDYSDES